MCKQTEAELKDDSLSPTLRPQCVYPFYSFNICLPYFTRLKEKKNSSFLPHSKQFADRLETLCAQLWRPNQFPNKSVTKDNLIDLRVCLSSRLCLQPQEGDGRGRPAELWASNSSLWAGRAYGAALIYFHSTTWKTVGSGYSNVFINLPRWAGASSRMGCCGNWRGEETHSQGREVGDKRVLFLCFVVVLIYEAILIWSQWRSQYFFFNFNLPETPVFLT